MKSIIIFLILVVFTTCTFARFASRVFDVPGVQFPKEYSDCGTVCPPKCGIPMPYYCTNICSPSIYCPRGTIEDRNGRCVKQCPKVYTDCGSPCPATCDNPKPEICPDACVKGEFCLPGFKDNGSGGCVLECPT